jgi:hypothetical protein
MKSQLRFALLSICLLLARIAGAQISIGENTQVRGTGSVSVGYSGGFGDSGPSTHSTTIGGTGDFQGFYYNPNLLSFSVNPYLNRSQNNSNYSAINDSSGVIATLGIFSGTHFPLRVSYNRQSDSTTTLGVGDGLGYTANGSGRTWSIGWRALVPHLPTFAVDFSDSNQQTSVYGTPGEYSAKARTFSVSSDYRLSGWQLSGKYQHTASNFDSPAFLTSTGSQTSANNGNEYLNATRSLPLQGVVLLSAARYNVGSDLQSTESNTISHTYSGSLTMSPWKRVMLNGGATYSDNLDGIINQFLVAQGSAPIVERSGSSSNLYSVYGGASVEITRRFFVTATANHIEQNWQGGNHSQTLFTGVANYTFDHGLLHSFRFSGGLSDSASEQGNRGLGALGTVNFDRRIKAWQAHGSFSYMHTIHTLTGIDNSSSMNYTASARREIARKYLLASFYGSHSGVQQYEGSNQSYNFSGTMGARQYSLTGTWGKSNGYSVLTSTGLAAVNPALPIGLLNPDSIISFNGNSYGFSGALYPIPKLTVSFTYNNLDNSTLAGLKNNFGSSNSFNTRILYKMRKLNFDAGITHIDQSISSSIGNRVAFTSYYFGISRWFTMF